MENGCRGTQGSPRAVVPIGTQAGWKARSQAGRHTSYTKIKKPHCSQNTTAHYEEPFLYKNILFIPSIIGIHFMPGYIS
jgi:hypothetical protein